MGHLVIGRTAISSVGESLAFRKQRRRPSHARSGMTGWRGAQARPFGCRLLQRGPGGTTKCRVSACTTVAPAWSCPAVPQRAAQSDGLGGDRGVVPGRCGNRVRRRSVRRSPSWAGFCGRGRGCTGRAVRPRSPTVGPTSRPRCIRALTSTALIPGTAGGSRRSSRCGVLGERLAACADGPAEDQSGRGGGCTWPAAPPVPTPRGTVTG